MRAGRERHDPKPAWSALAPLVPPQDRSYINEWANKLPGSGRYHIQAIYDLQADNTTAKFRTEIAECRKVIAQLVADDNSSDQQIARVNILRYLDLQLSRATT
jgi:hypothetical protein